MDRLVDWLRCPAERLTQMLVDHPGFSPLIHASLAIHDPVRDLVCRFDCGTPRSEVQEIEMGNAPFFTMLAGTQKPRVIRDVAELGDGARQVVPVHQLGRVRSLLIRALHHDGELLGFVSFGGAFPGFFGPMVQEVSEPFVDAYAILIQRGRDALEAI
jgi:hypothetical protein